MQEEHVDGIIHLAAESHVDRSIKDPFTFAQTNVMGTLSLLQAAKAYWEPMGWVMQHYAGDAFSVAKKMADAPAEAPAAASKMAEASVADAAAKVKEDKKDE